MENWCYNIAYTESGEVDYDNTDWVGARFLRAVGRSKASS